MMLVVFVAMLVAPSATSLPVGISGVKDSGCNCHGATPDAAVTATISGLPATYNYSESYEITVSFSGGPSDSGNINQGGFHLWVSDGELSVTDATAQSFNPNEAGHTEAGNDQSSWIMTWTAPATDRNVEFVLHVNSVNGDADGSGGGSTGDAWNRVSTQITGPIEVLEQADPFVVLSVLVLVCAVLLGEETDTLDPTGDVIKTAEVPALTVEDVHAALAIFKNGCVAQISANYTTDARLERYEIHGRDISAYLEGIRGGTIHTVGDDPQPMATDRPDGATAQARYFLDCVRDHRPIGLPAANLDEAVKTMELCEAILAGLRA